MSLTPQPNHLTPEGALFPDFKEVKESPEFKELTHFVALTLGVTVLVFVLGRLVLRKHF